LEWLLKEPGKFQGEGALLAERIKVLERRLLILKVGQLPNRNAGHDAHVTSANALAGRPADPVSGYRS